MFLSKFKGCFNGGSRPFQRRFKDVSGVLKESIKDILRKFQKQISNVFQERFNEVFFVILLLQGSHRSYPSIRRACSKSIL